MTVVKSKRKQSPLEAFNNYFKMRMEIYQLVYNGFGYSSDKYQKAIDKCKEENTPSSASKVITMERKQKAFDEWFIDEQTRVVTSIAQQLGDTLVTANAIYPYHTSLTKVFEWYERRRLFTKCIGLCRALQKEIEFTINQLPVDKNQIVRFTEMIDLEIKLIKGLRHDTNKFVKDADDTATDVAIKSFLKQLNIVVNKFVNAKDTDDSAITDDNVEQSH